MYERIFFWLIVQYPIALRLSLCMRDGKLFATMAKTSQRLPICRGFCSKGKKHPFVRDIHPGIHYDDGKPQPIHCPWSHTEKQISFKWKMLLRYFTFPMIGAGTFGISDEKWKFVSSQCSITWEGKRYEHTPSTAVLCKLFLERSFLYLHSPA